MSPQELIVDSFAGGGGASLGIELALGRSPDIAINHDAEAIALHAANHPGSTHFREDVWKVDPREACGGRPVGLMWLSPDCKHFSKAKGGKPVSKRVRGLAWVAVRWAVAVRPRIIVLENVEEFQTWGPLAENGRPCPSRKGLTFRRFVGRLRNLGYAVEWRELRACDYGAPTSRKRLFLVARCDGQPIVWPKPTHGKTTGRPWRTAAECLDWSIPCPSIFGRARPLAENTQRRIAAGLRRFVLESPRPYLVQVQNASSGDAPISIDAPMRTVTAHPKGGGFALVAPTLVEYHAAKRDGDDRAQPVNAPLPTQDTSNRFGLVAPVLVPRYGERDGQQPRAATVEQPMPTIVPTQNGGSLVAAFLARHFTGVDGSSLFAPVPTVTSIDHHSLVTATLAPGATDRRAEVRAFLVAYYGNERDGQSLFDPVRTLSTRDRMGLVTIHGHDYVIADIGLRMLAPRELYRAQGFPDSYRIDIPFNGKPLTKTAQVRMCGNSVCPPVAAAIVAANVYGRVVEVAA
jgi:DNA (cytosine-5)-methyltransferase 1